MKGSAEKQVCTVTTTVKWAMGHRLGRGYQGKCQCLHGHNYKAEITLEGFLDNRGMVIDFEIIKFLLHDWIMKTLDHATITTESDITLIEFLVNTAQKHYVLDSSYANSTAECLCILFADQFQKILVEEGVEGINVKRIRIYETDNSYTEWVDE